MTTSRKSAYAYVRCNSQHLTDHQKAYQKYIKKYDMLTYPHKILPSVIPPHSPAEWLSNWLPCFSLPFSLSATSASAPASRTLACMHEWPKTRPRDVRQRHEGRPYARTDDLTIILLIL